MNGQSRLKRWSFLLASGAMLAALGANGLIAQGLDGGSPVIAPLNPTFIAWQKAKESAKQPMALRSNARIRNHGRMPSPVDLSHIRGQLFGGLDIFPKTYDLRALNQVRHSVIYNHANTSTSEHTAFALSGVIVMNHFSSPNNLSRAFS